ncbi:hypothetical protein F4780DRAFT_273660 [Xylariomycetidae sp. FL0641]|nr:hypothetical protein F4780DRAFT_273660 [Xylariomycetidae sp. FL0641]
MLNHSRKRDGRGLSRFSWAIATLSTLLSLLFVFIVLLSGVGGYTPAKFLTIDVTNLNAPAKLRGSTLLQDLTQVSGTDLVGQDGTVVSLGLGNTYDVALLTACWHGGSSTGCDAPHIGYSFDPGSDLKLDGTWARASFTPAYSSKIQTHRQVTTFACAAYILVILLHVLSSTGILLSARLPRARLISVTASSVSTLLLFAAAVAGTASFSKQQHVFTKALHNYGVTVTTASSGPGLSFSAFALSLLALVAVLAQPRPHPPRRASPLPIAEAKFAFPNSPYNSGDSTTTRIAAEPTEPPGEAPQRKPTGWTRRSKYAPLSGSGDGPVTGADVNGVSPRSSCEGGDDDDARAAFFGTGDEGSSASWTTIGQGRLSQRFAAVDTTYKPHDLSP